MAKTQEKKDPMLVGYKFTYAVDKNPYDYIADPETGMRPDMHTVPGAFVKNDLGFGIDTITLPPLAVWREGEWLSEMDASVFEATSLALPTEVDRYDTWVVSGEGTPGNYQWRMYILPNDASRRNLLKGNIPKHPMMWSQKLKDGMKSTFKSSGSDYWKFDQKTTTTTKKDDGLPYGVRIRCTQCGHWFKADDLPNHIKCCPQANGFSDWAIACECCDSMDDTALVKAGFPRDFIAGKPKETEPKEEKKSVEELVEWANEGVTDDGAGEAATERPPGDPADTEGSIPAV